MTHITYGSFQSESAKYVKHLNGGESISEWSMKAIRIGGFLRLNLVIFMWAWDCNFLSWTLKEKNASHPFWLEYSAGCFKFLIR